MKVIGITGPIGSGKSYVSAIFSENGIPVIDTDDVYHRLISAYTDTVKEIVFFFGESVLADNGGIDRARLGKIVFEDSSLLKKLNEITHKFVRIEAERILSDYRTQGKKAVVLEVPLMFESGFDKLCDTVISVIADDEVRVQRIMKRNGFSRSEAENRLKKQKDNKFYIANSNKVLYNNEDDDVKVAVQSIIDELK